jgi:2-succinyl-5-enolpyruvyl-6-hydroxy-3-cyclohexene-1-carboxylate synthase
VILVNLSTSLARVIVDELIRCGVREAVLCPGSRSAPLAFALHMADARAALRLHVRIDERGAAYLALGLALRSGLPVPVVCTSGTAVANLHPAVLESSHAGVPLLLITADRPPELIGIGASQTIDQLGIFGAATRAAMTVGPAEGRAGESARWRTAIGRAVAAASGVLSCNPGPVHLNVPFREPLVPDGGRAEASPGRPGAACWTEVGAARITLPELMIAPSEPTLVLGGDGGHGVIPDGVPVVAEPSAPLWPRSLRTGAWLLSAAVSGAEPGLLPTQVVVLGRPTLHRSVQRLLADPRMQIFAVPPSGPATELADNTPRPWWCDTAASVAQVGALPSNWVVDPAFGERWARADSAATLALDRALDAETMTAAGVARGNDPIRVARDIAAMLPVGSLLVAGPSSPVRDLALAAAPRPDITVLSNRGVSGIDGVVSTAIGAALAHDGPAYALMGDITLLHDANGLLAGPDEPCPDLTIVVANDNGGSVFALLEQGEPQHEGSFERLFGTPHHADLSALARAYGIEHHRLANLSALPAALSPVGGLRLIEVPVDRAGRRDRYAVLRQTIEAAAAAANEEMLIPGRRAQT